LQLNWWERVTKYVFNLRILYEVLITSPLLFTDFLTRVLTEVSASGLSLVQMSPSEYGVSRV